MGPRRFRRGCSKRSIGSEPAAGRFNGAATFPSRMYQFVDAAGVFDAMASMGPRRFRRGCKDFIATFAPHLPLQWGRDVSVADV